MFLPPPPEKGKSGSQRGEERRGRSDLRLSTLSTSSLVLKRRGSNDKGAQFPAPWPPGELRLAERRQHPPGRDVAATPPLCAPPHGCAYIRCRHCARREPVKAPLVHSGSTFFFVEKSDLIEVVSSQPWLLLSDSKLFFICVSAFLPVLQFCYGADRRGFHSSD